MLIRLNADDAQSVDFTLMRRETLIAMFECECTAVSRLHDGEMMKASRRSVDH